MVKNVVRLAVGIAAAAAPLGLFATPAHAAGSCQYQTQAGEVIELNDGETVIERNGDSSYGFAWVCQESTLIFAGLELMS